MIDIKKESEMLKPVIEDLEANHWEVWQEVGMGSGIVDIVCKRDGIVWAIEGKTSLGLSVLYQAEDRKPYAHYVSVAVPAPSRGISNTRNFAYDICRWLGIGVLCVNKRGVVYEAISPRLNRSSHEFVKRYTMKSLVDERKLPAVEAGSKGGGHWTPYKQTIAYVKRFLTGGKEAPLKEIIDALKGSHHYASDAGALSSIRKALENWESDWCGSKRVGNKNYYFIKRQEDKHEL